MHDCAASAADGPLPSDVALGVVGDVVFKRDLGASYVATGDVKRSTTTASPENADAGADVEHPPKPTTGVPRSQHDAWADAAAWAQTPPTSIVAHGAAILVRHFVSMFGRLCAHDVVCSHRVSCL